MRYMLIHAADPELASKWDDEAQAAFTSWIEETIRSGVSLEGSRLRLDADATTVKIRDGELIITDGPYAETKEQVAGYDVIECASLDEAVRWAGRHPSSWMGAVEVRALAGRAPAAPCPSLVRARSRYMMLVCTDPAVDPQGVRPHRAGRSLGSRDGRPGRTPVSAANWSRPAVPARSG